MYSLQFLILFASFTPFSFGFLIGIGKYDITGPVTGVDFVSAVCLQCFFKEYYYKCFPGFMYNL